MTPEDIVKVMHAASKFTAARETMTLGQIIREVEKAKPDAVVNFAFARLSPNGIASSRGTYSQLAIGYAVDRTVIAADMLTMLRGANGSTFDGYKGGEYVMDLDTPVWVDNWGEWTGTAIVSIEVENGETYSTVTIHTARVER